MPGPTKGNAASVAAGQRGAARRWGPTRVVRLDDLSNEQRAFVLEVLEVTRRNAPKLAAPGEDAA